MVRNYFKILQLSKATLSPKMARCRLYAKENSRNRTRPFDMAHMSHMVHMKWVNFTDHWNKV